MVLDKDINSIKEQENKLKEQKAKLDKKAKAQAAKLEIEQKKADTEFKRLQEKIKSGNSTGDLIKDFVIVNFHTLDDKHVDRFRKLDDEAKKAVGEPFLVVRYDSQFCGKHYLVYSPTNEPGYYSIEATPNVGILKSPLKFDLKEGVLIPTEQYVSKRSRGYSREFWEINKGNMKFHFFDLLRLDHNLHAGLTSADPRSGLSLYFGNKAVEEQFKKNPDAERYRKMFGDELAEKLAKSRKKPEFIDSSYARALQILGVKEIPVNFKEAYVKEMTPKAQEMLLDLQGHAFERASLLKKIEDTRKNAKDGKVIESNFDETRHYSVPVEEHLAPTKRAVADVERKIISSLEDVARLGIPQFDLVVQQGLQGAPFNLSKELYLMCEQYSVDPTGINIKNS